jgi:hypothetical protein
MRATRTNRTASRRTSRPAKRAKRAASARKGSAAKVGAKLAGASAAAGKPTAVGRPGAAGKLVRAAFVAPEPVLYRLCKPGWAVLVERIANAQGTRFVCPFCPKSHRVPGPVRGFKKMRHAQWGRLRRVEE